MNDILKRALSGAVFVAIMISAFVYNVYTAFGLLLILSLIGLFEFYKLFAHQKRVFPQQLIGTIGGGYVFFAISSIYFKWLNELLFTGVVIFFFIVLVSELYRKKGSPSINIAITLFGWVYVPILFFFIVLIRDFSELAEWRYVIGMFILIWSNDSFAYLTGRWLGKNKLLERISPKKTWEGTFGGVFFAMTFALIYAYVIDADFLFWSISGLLVAIASVFGDLFESLLKRDAGVKDSGNIMPGHGGVLDRFDAALFAAPIFYVWLYVYSIM